MYNWPADWPWPDKPIIGSRIVEESLPMCSLRIENLTNLRRHYDGASTWGGVAGGTNGHHFWARRHRPQTEPFSAGHYHYPYGNYHPTWTKKEKREKKKKKKMMMMMMMKKTTIAWMRWKQSHLRLPMQRWTQQAHEDLLCIKYVPSKYRMR